MFKTGLFFAITLSVCGAREVMIGQRQIDLPSPSSMRDVTDTDTPGVRVLKGVVGPQSRVLAVFVCPDFPTALYPYIQVSKNVDYESREWSAGKFTEFVNYIKTQTSTKANEEKFDLLSSAWKAGADAVIKRELGTKVVIDVGKPLFLSESERGDRHTTLPFLMRLSVTDNGVATDTLVVGTMTFMVLRSKLVYVYYYDRFDGMASRDAAIVATRGYVGSLLSKN